MEALETMRYALVIILATMTALSLLLPLAYGQDAAQKEKALAEIEKAADYFCQSVPIEQNSSGSKLNAQGKAELKGLASKIVDLGLSASAEHSSSRSRGVLQEDLASAIAESDNCKVNVLRILFPAFLTPGTNMSSPAPRASSPSEINSPSEADTRPRIADAAISGAPQSYDTISMRSPAGRIVQCEVLISALDATQRNQVRSFLGDAIRQGRAAARPACVLEILSLDVSPTSGPGCPASLATLQYEIQDTAGSNAPTRSVQYSKCYGADGPETDMQAIQGVVGKLLSSLDTSSLR